MEVRCAVVAGNYEGDSIKIQGISKLAARCRSKLDVAIVFALVSCKDASSWRNTATLAASSRLWVGWYCSDSSTLQHFVKQEFIAIKKTILNVKTKHLT